MQMFYFVDFLHGIDRRPAWSSSRHVILFLKTFEYGKRSYRDVIPICQAKHRRFLWSTANIQQKAP